MQKYTASDFESFCDVICNDEVMLYISGKGNSREVANEKFEAILKTNKENDFYTAQQYHDHPWPEKVRLALH